MQYSQVNRDTSINKQCLKIGHWNLNGIMSKQLGYKLEQREVFNMVQNFDIFGVSETHLLPNNGKQLDTFTDFHSYRKPGKRQNYGSGGISVYIKSNIVKGTSVIHGESPDFIWVCLKKSYFQLEDDIFIGFIYISPINSGVSNSQEYQSFELLEKDICKFKSKGKILIMGDLNSRVGSLPDFNVTDDDKYTPVPDIYKTDEDDSCCNRRNEDSFYTNEYGKRLTELCIAAELRILNGRTLGDLDGKLTCHKWNGSSVVDYGIVQSDIFYTIDYFKVHDFLGHLSDHSFISLGLKCKFKNRTNECLKNTHTINSTFKWDSQSELVYRSTLSSNSIREKINKLCHTCSDTSMTVDDMTEKTNTILLTAANQVLVKRKCSRKHNQKKRKWFDKDCFYLRRDVIRLGRQLCRSRATHTQRMLFFQRKRELRQIIKRKKRMFRQNILDQLNDMSDNNPKQYWKLIKELKELDSNSGNGTSPITPEEWFKHFSKLLFTDKQSTCSQLEGHINEMLSCNSFSNLDYIITKDEIKCAILSLKPGKAIGLDTISSEMVKSSITALQDVYDKLFNRILREGTYPRLWRESYITPIYKAGGRNDPSNYRGIAINNILGKVFSIILNSRLEKFIKANNLIDDTQIGFKKNCRTTDHMFVLRTLIDKYVKKLKSPLYVCFVDFRKAYDSVWRQALMFKLLSQNVSGMFFKLLKSMYLNNDMCVKINVGERTSFFQSNVGLLQGDNISPLLFNLYVSDLKDYLGVDNATPKLVNSNVNCLMYADDLILLSRSELGLQVLLNRLGDYCRKWRMDVNTDKTKVMKFSGNGHKCKTVFLYKDRPIENVPNYKYLGIEFNSCGSWSSAISNISNRGLKALFLLKGYICSGNIKPCLGLKLFDQMIKPILCYGSELWSAFDSNKKSIQNKDGIAKFLDSLDIEKVHVKFCKFILGVNKRAVNLAVKGELGRFPIGISCMLQALKYWFHIQTSNNGLLREALVVSENLHKEHVFTWYSFFTSLCKMLDMKVSEVTVATTTLLRMKLCDKYIQYWSGSIKSFSKLDTYSSVKQNFGMENYISDVKTRPHRITLTKMRISNHRLAIETGRFSRIPRNDRVCGYCKANDIFEIEDEKHVLLRCAAYSDIRSELFTSVRNHCPNFDVLDEQNKLFYLLNSSGSVIQDVARFYHASQTIHLT